MNQTVTPMTDNPLLTPSRAPEDPDAALRPKTLAEFVGQEAARQGGLAAKQTASIVLP
jgi:Holliday junction resolvasome RuvABC ATP-dependent DNA helicase subunit